MIGIDWGTTRLRAYWFDAEGRVREKRESAQGAGRLARPDFEVTLDPLIQGWSDASPDSPVRVVLSGMVGSRQGWREVPYVSCPAGLAEIHAGCVQVSPNRWIVPGLASDAREVMRGEETQILGAIREGESVRIVAPGTHSKWAVVERGQIVGFRTHMTGELYALLTQHSILARSIVGDAHDEAAFSAGVERSLGNRALLNQLFSVRIEALFERIAPTALAAYLSGILIGAEIASETPASPEPIVLIASARLAGKYASALGLAGFRNVRLVDGDEAAARGLWRIGQELSS